MKTTACALIALALLAGCGVDGPPTPPPAKAAQPAASGNITVSGEGRFGISKG
jgi:predicted small lipoprotein YifL